MSDENIDQPYNAADETQVNNARKRASRLKYNRLKVVEAMMQNKETRQYLWDLMDGCFMWEDPVISGDTHATYSNLGRQHIGKQILVDCLQFPELYMRMVSENKKQR